MADFVQTTPTPVKKFIRDYFHTFNRLLHSNMPAPPWLLDDVNREDAAGWTWGQRVAFASISAIAMWALVAGLIYWLA